MQYTIIAILAVNMFYDLLIFENTIFILDQLKLVKQSFKRLGELQSSMPLFQRLVSIRSSITKQEKKIFLKE